MDKKIKIKYIDKPVLKKEADAFREQHWNGKLPINIENIIERMGVEIVPLSGLFKSFGIDALITSDWKLILVDNESYMSDNFQNRIRFSLAHEVGHLILHKEIYASFGIKSEDDFYALFENISEEEYGKLEVQADMFANNLLIPRDLLIKERDAIIAKYNSKIKEIEKDLLNSYMAIPISKAFGVTDTVIKIALDNL